MVTGIILAGGHSSRAKTNKLLLLVDSKPLISHTIDSLKSHVDKLVVVTGRYDKELRPYLNDVIVAYNKDYPTSRKPGVRKASSAVGRTRPWRAVR